MKRTVLRQKVLKYIYPKLDKYFYENEEKNFLREMVEQNLERILIIQLVAIVSESALYILPAFVIDYKNILLIFILFSIPLTIILLLVRKDYSKYSYIFLNIIQLLCISNYILFTMSLMLITQGNLDLIHIYISMLMFLVVTMHLPFFTMVTLLFVSTLATMVVFPFFQPNYETAILLLSNILIFNLVSTFMGIYANKQYVNNFLILKTLESKNILLEDLSQRDTMTHFYNHVSILKLITHHAEKSKIENYPLVMLILDLDDFKLVNDRYGHLKGDEVLLEVAEILKSKTRNSDLIGRYGGEEFFVLFPNTSMMAAIQVSERIRETIAGRNMLGIKVTISGGLSLYNGEDVNEFIRITDNKLYVAKRLGKNQIIHTEEIEENSESQLKTV